VALRTRSPRRGESINDGARSHPRRLFENLDPEQIALERTRIPEGEAGVTHMHYRVQG
jgi:hypothetical protein